MISKYQFQKGNYQKLSNSSFNSPNSLCLFSGWSKHSDIFERNFLKRSWSGISFIALCWKWIWGVLFCPTRIAGFELGTCIWIVLGLTSPLRFWGEVPGLGCWAWCWLIGIKNSPGSLAFCGRWTLFPCLLCCCCWKGPLLLGGAFWGWCGFEIWRVVDSGENWYLLWGGGCNCVGWDLGVTF